MERWRDGGVERWRNGGYIMIIIVMNFRKNFSVSFLEFPQIFFSTKEIQFIQFCGAEGERFLMIELHTSSINQTNGEDNS